MKKTEKKVLKAKLLSAFKRIVKENKAYLSGNGEKALEKSIKKIVRKTSQKRDTASKTKIRTSVLHAHKYNLDGSGVKPSKQVLS